MSNTITPWYAPATRQVILPLAEPNRWHDPERVLWQLKRLGVGPLTEIALPLDLGYRFFLGTLPPWLTLRDDDEGMYDFEDGKGRLRLRINSRPISRGVWVMTRYRTTDHLNGEFMPLVLDTECDDGERVVWHGTEGEAFSDCHEAAALWLDEHFPDWRDPLAYWSE